jgi:CHAD domain-containing protein
VNGETPAAEAQGATTSDPSPIDAPVAAVVPVEVQDVIGAELANSIQRLTRAEAQLRTSDDPEVVHQARVATRRIRSTLRVFRPLLEVPWSDQLRKRLSPLAETLGAARDADVLLARLDDRISALPKPDAKAAATLRTKLDAQRAGARAELITYIDGQSFKRLLSTLAEAAARPRFALEPREARSALDAAAAAWEKLCVAVDALGDEPANEELHQIRLLAKRARYAAETVAAVARPGAEKFVARAAGLQDVLGELQDAAVAQAWLRSAGVRSTPRISFVAGRISGAEAAAEVEARRSWRRAWERLDRKKNTEWLGPHR